MVPVGGQNSCAAVRHGHTLLSVLHTQSTGLADMYLHTYISRAIHATGRLVGDAPQDVRTRSRGTRGSHGE